MNYIVIDFEMNNKWKSDIHEIIEIGAVKLNNELKLQNIFESYVKPRIHPILSKQIRQKTKIIQENINIAEDFTKVMENFKKWVGNDDYIICGWGVDELFILEKQYKLYSINRNIFTINKFINVQEQYCLINKINRLISLKEALISFNININNKLHRALVDAMYASEILKKIFNSIGLNKFVCFKCYKTHNLNETCYQMYQNRFSSYKFDDLTESRKEFFDNIIQKIKPGIPYSHFALVKTGIQFNEIKKFVGYAKLDILKKRRSCPILIGYDVNNYSQKDIKWELE